MTAATGDTHGRLWRPCRAQHRRCPRLQIHVIGLLLRDAIQRRNTQRLSVNTFVTATRSFHSRPDKSLNLHNVAFACRFSRARPACVARAAMLTGAWSGMKSLRLVPFFTRSSARACRATGLQACAVIGRFDFTFSTLTPYLLTSAQSTPTGASANNRPRT